MQIDPGESRTFEGAPWARLGAGLARPRGLLVIESRGERHGRRWVGRWAWHPFVGRPRLGHCLELRWITWRGRGCGLHRGRLRGHAMDRRSHEHGWVFERRDFVWRRGQRRRKPWRLRECLLLRHLRLRHLPPRSRREMHVHEVRRAHLQALTRMGRGLRRERRGPAPGSGTGRAGTDYRGEASGDDHADANKGSTQTRVSKTAPQSTGSPSQPHAFTFASSGKATPRSPRASRLGVEFA